MPHQLTSEPVAAPDAAPPVRSRGSVAPAPRRRDTPIPVRLGLQQRASTNLRNHLLRAARRLTALVVADLASFAVMRALLRAVRDGAALGPWIASHVGAVVPPGILNGWQYAVALLVALVVTGNYGRGDARRNPRRLLFACALATALPLWMTLWTVGFEPVLVQYGVTTALVWLGLAVERRTIDRIVARVWPAGRHAPATLFVGPAEECRSAMASPAFSTEGEYHPVGFVDARSPRAADAAGHVADFAELLHAVRAETVVICGHLSDARFHEVVDAALTAGCQVLSVPQAMMEMAGVQPTLVWRQEQPLIELTAPTLKGQQLVIKRIVDLIGSICALVVAAPLMIAIAITIKRDSPGPILFAQERVGLGGRRFRMLKFRTMRNGADSEKKALAHLNHTGDPRLFKIPNDPRVTNLGRLLRRWSLDELPQLWNVLVGDMSLVGPRPFFESDLETYEDDHFLRLGAKPGITGLWQVSGRSGIVDFEHVVALDTEYVRNWSLLLDLKILLRTVPAVLGRRGAI